MAHVETESTVSTFDCPFEYLLEGIELTRTDGELDTTVTSVCFDSRLAQPGSLFVALRGGYTDGHRYLRQARELGASAALVETWSDDLQDFPAIAQVADTRAALAQVARRFYRDPGASIGVVGVTGTDGKTTTSFLVDAILRYAGKRTGLIGTVSVRIADEITDHDTRQTTPESLEIQHHLSEMRAAEVDWAVLEATSHGLALHRLDTCPFDIAVVTNITHEHLDFHGTVEAYRLAKARLLEMVGTNEGRDFPRGVVLNRDDEGARSIADHAGKHSVLWYGIEHPDCDLSATNIVVTDRGTSFDLHMDGMTRRVQLNLIGTYNVFNALAAAGAAKIVGLGLDVIADGLGALESVPGRLVRIDEGQPFNVFVDYAHTPDSIEKTIGLLRSLNQGRIIVVFGSAGERDRAKRAVQGSVAASLADFAVFTSEDPRFEDPDAIIAEIAGGAIDAGALEGSDFVRCEDRQRAIEIAVDAAEPGDVVLLAGKGHEKCIIYGAERRPWDEETVARTVLRSRGFAGAHGMGNR